ncbi:DUF1801 domain-containing protein [Falsihalocynthiibacter sp. S25ZX9]|uniref:DUF1801 domain-containing protein n=1 Tax=Falsihalocynthiibacter sp. S25ZX9 TaxID=3240870 RepID=UPI00350EB405
MANKTLPTDVPVDDFLAAVPSPQKRADAVELDALFRRVTRFDPVMWGPSIVGYGRYHYQYESGREGDFLATGFSPRKANFSIYILPGYADFSDILASLGKFKIGKSCLYFNKLADIDVAILERLISAGLKDLNTRWPLNPS